MASVNAPGGYDAFLDQNESGLMQNGLLCVRSVAGTSPRSAYGTVG